MLPEYADYCYGEGNMHDTVMLQREHGVNLAGAGAGEQLGDKLHLAVIFIPAQQAEQHDG
jgi:hypothetical protein